MSEARALIAIVSAIMLVLFFLMSVGEVSALSAFGIQGRTPKTEILEAAIFISLFFLLRFFSQDLIEASNSEEAIESNKDKKFDEDEFQNDLFWNIFYRGLFSLLLLRSIFLEHFGENTLSRHFLNFSSEGNISTIIILIFFLIYVILHNLDLLPSFLRIPMRKFMGFKHDAPYRGDERLVASQLSATTLSLNISACIVIALIIFEEAGLSQAPLWAYALFIAFVFRFFRDLLIYQMERQG
ncbi:hypothetical protein AAD018_008030 [Aestuariibius insulae]|uniref:hypothetical protein n=1 Tax=Aestuariibius insulae TaxID=2058287 RepID=UPI00345E4F3C